MDLKHALATTTVTCFLRDGRTVDLTGLTPEDAVATLRAEGVTPGDVRHTVFFVHGPLPRPFVGAPR
jgi:hypothetical protein